MEVQVNFMAVLTAVVVNFILGFVWYTPLFGKAWAKEMGMEPDAKPESGVMMKGMAFMVIGNFLFAWVFAHNIAAWEFVPGAGEMGFAGTVLSSAIFTWLGFYVPGRLGATVWEKRSWKLTFINAGYDLTALLVVAAILVYWR